MQGTWNVRQTGPGGLPLPRGRQARIRLAVRLGSPPRVAFVLHSLRPRRAARILRIIRSRRPMRALRILRAMRTMRPLRTARIVRLMRAQSRLMWMQ